MIYVLSAIVILRKLALKKPSRPSNIVVPAKGGGLGQVTEIPAPGLSTDGPSLA
jgi:hypothetical protein